MSLFKKKSISRLKKESRVAINFFGFLPTRLRKKKAAALTRFRSGNLDNSAVLLWVARPPKGGSDTCSTSNVRFCTDTAPRPARPSKLCSYSGAWFFPSFLPANFHLRRERVFANLNFPLSNLNFQQFREFLEFLNPPFFLFLCFSETLKNELFYLSELFKILLGDTIDKLGGASSVVRSKSTTKKKAKSCSHPTSMQLSGQKRMKIEKKTKF